MSGEGLMGMGSWPGSRVETGWAGRARADRWVCDIYTPMLFLRIQVAVAFSRRTVDAERGICSRECGARQDLQRPSERRLGTPRAERERERERYATYIHLIRCGYQ